MFRRQRQPAPYFRMPGAPFNPATGERAPLGRYPVNGTVLATFQVVENDTHDNYIVCRGFEPQADPQFRHLRDPYTAPSSSPISVAKPYSLRGTFPYEVGQVIVAARIRTRLGDNQGVASTTVGQPADLDETIELLLDDNSVSVAWIDVGVAAQSQSQPDGTPFVNESGESIPAWAPMWNAGAGIVVTSGTAYVVCARPSTMFDTHWLVNGGSAVADTATSRGYWRFEKSGPVRVDPSLDGQVVVGDELGVVPGQFYLGANRKGFIALGGTRTDSGELVVDCRQRQVTTVFGKSYVNISEENPSLNYVTQNAAGTMTVEFEIWRRLASGTPMPAGWDKLTVYLTFLNKNEKLKHGTFGRANWYTDEWEGDFACDPDDRDTGAQSPGAQEQQFLFHGPDPGETDDPIQLIQNGTI